jgi:hypothetical protein
MSIRLCYMVVIIVTLLEIAPIASYSNPRRLFQFSQICSVKQSEYHSDMKPILDKGYVDDNNNVDSNNGVITETPKEKKNFRTADRLNFTYDLKKLALMRYKEIHGDMIVPSLFVISDDSSEFPKEVWKMKLGFIVNHIRWRNDHGDMKDELIALGFDYTSQKYSFDQIKIALIKYQELNGNMIVPKMYVIPMNNLFMEEFWGMKLGDIVSKIRNSNSYAEKKDELIALGFNYESQLKHTYEDIEKALLKYKELYGDMLVSLKYVIPLDSTDFQEKVCGMKLGYIVNNIRSGNTCIYTLAQTYIYICIYIYTHINIHVCLYIYI